MKTKTKSPRTESSDAHDVSKVLRDALAFQDAAASRAMQIAQSHLMEGRRLQAALRATAMRNRRIVL